MPTLAMVLTGVILTIVSGSRVEMAAQMPEAWVISRTAETPPESGPFAGLLDHRAELALTSTQLGTIRAVRQRLVRENEALVAQIRDAELWGVESEEDAAAIAAVREELDANTSAAEREVEEVLTAEQRETAAALLGGASLAYATPAPGDSTGGGPVEDEAGETGRVSRADAVSTTVRVENLNFHDATVYVYSGAQRQRLGFVTGLTTQVFTIPAPLLSGGSGLRFQVQPIARSRSRLSNEVVVNPGDEVLVRIPPV